MKNIANDHLLQLHHAAGMEAAHDARSKELARLFGKAVRAIKSLFSDAASKEKPVSEMFKKTPANANAKKDEHYLAA